MDIDVTLQALRNAVMGASIYLDDPDGNGDPDGEYDPEELAYQLRDVTELFSHLDAWMTRHGFTPKAWSARA